MYLQSVKKTNTQLNAISRIGTYLGQKEKETLINSFVYSNFNYDPLIWHFTTRKGINKIEKVQERSLKFILNDYDKDRFSIIRYFQETIYASQKTSNPNNRNFQNIKCFKFSFH